MEFFCFFFSVANSESDIHYGWRLGNNKSVNFDTKVLLSQFDLIQYPQYDEITDMNGRMSLKKNFFIIIIIFY